MSSEHQQNTRHFNSFNNNNSFNNIVNLVTHIGDEGPQILEWLSPLEPQRRHQGVRADRLPGVGNWVLETSEFREWHDGEDGCVGLVLFCSGNAGVGKTYVSSLVIDSLCDQAGRNAAVVGLYCDYSTQQEQSSTNILGAMLKQLARRDGIPGEIRETFQNAKGEFGGRGLLLHQMVDILKETIASLPRLFICIDGLDECTPKHRRDLLGSLGKIVEASPNIRVFLTGRPHIEKEIVEFFSQAVRIPLSPSGGDIKSYLRMKLDYDTDAAAMNDDLRADIMRIIPEVSESFLLVSLNVDAILGEFSLQERRRKLGKMTEGEGIQDTYAAKISRMKAQPGMRSKLGMDVLMWVVHAERPLHVDELRHALGVVKGSADLDTRNIPTLETLLACSQGLVTVEKSTSTLRLVHYTLQEYLSHNSNLLLKPHSFIAEVCLTYLNFRHVCDFSPGLPSVPPTAPFVEYASCYWGTHARRDTTESVKTLASKLLYRYDEHISSKILLLHGVWPWEQPSGPEDTPRGFTGLHGAAYLGCVEIMIALLETNKWDVQATDFNGNTPLTWAARWGHEEAVRVLLEQDDVILDVAGKWNRTPFWLAAANGHEGVVRMLLARGDVNPDHADEFGETPLFWAASNGHEGVVRMLLERDVSLNKANNWGSTPLSRAVDNGHDGVVGILLERNVITETTVTEYCQNRLLLAAKNGEDRVVKTLLQWSDINPEQAGKWNRTPLWLAAEHGHEGVVRMLLARGDVNPDHADQFGETPLFWAASNGHEGVVRMLLERDVSLNKANNWGSTPLSRAVENGHSGVVRMLKHRTYVDPDKANNPNPQEFK